MSLLAASGPPGLVHAAVIGRDHEELVRHCLPELRGVVADGGRVEVCADRRRSRHFREQLPGVDVHVIPPGELDARALPLRLTEATTPVVIAGSACAEAVLTEGSAEATRAEDTISVLLDARPVTVLCLYDSADPVALEVAQRTHPWLITADGRVANPDHRPPAVSSPVPGDLLGERVLEVPIRDSSALADLRRRIAAEVAGRGWSADVVADAVLAAHEALLLSADTVLDPAAPADLPEGEHAVAVRSSPRGVVLECRGSLVRPRTLLEVDARLRMLTDLWERTTVHAERDGRMVRVLVGRR